MKISHKADGIPGVFGLFALAILASVPFNLSGQMARPLTCVVMQAPFEYTLTDLHGPRPAFDLELCHAVAVALQTRVTPLELPDETAAVAALKTGQADMVPTLSADLSHLTDPTLLLAPPILLDGIGLLVPLSTPSAASLAGHKICFFAGTETEMALHTWFRVHHLDFIPYPFSEEGEMQAAFTSGNCPAIAGDATRLAVIHDSLHRARDYKLLHETIAPDPLSSAVLRTNARLARVVVVVEQLLLNAALLEIDRANLSSKIESDDPAVRRLLGLTHEVGPWADLDDRWPVRVLQAVGNYDELTHRTLPLALPNPPASPLK